LRSLMTSGFESGPALIAKAPPQQRPRLMRPSWVKRKTGRRCFFASCSAWRMSSAQPISSRRFSSGLGCNTAIRFETQAGSSASLSMGFLVSAEVPSGEIAHTKATMTVFK